MFEPRVRQRGIGKMIAKSSTTPITASRMKLEGRVLTDMLRGNEREGRENAGGRERGPRGWMRKETNDGDNGSIVSQSI
jgi:hypothetical protein